MITVLKYGTWDPLHVGHLNVLEFAAQLGDRLIVGVATDEYIRTRKGSEPLMPYHDRARIIGALRMVDAVIPYNGPEDITPVKTGDGFSPVIEKGDVAPTINGQHADVKVIQNDF